MNNPFLENLKEALDSEGKSLSQEDQELLLRDSESTEGLSDKEKESINIITHSLFKSFFNNTKEL